jgi:hypothetical protein
MSETTTASDAFERWKRDVPAREAARKEAAARGRAAERSSAEPVALTLDALLIKLSFSRDYAEHLMQPYCDCDHGWDGWDFCAHARDLGWPERDSSIP